MSSASHMMTAVPAVMAMTIVPNRNRLVSGMISLPCGQLGNRFPLRASAMIAVDWSTASATVRYRVIWVSRCSPALPSFFSSSRRGITTTSNWMMMLDVMYGMMPRAKIDNWSSAPPLKRLISE